MFMIDFNRFKIDLAPVKLFVSILAIYLACMSNIATAAPRTVSYDPGANLLQTRDSISCAAPYLAEHCQSEAIGSCTIESLFPKVLRNATWNNTTKWPFCSYPNLSKNQNNES